MRKMTLHGLHLLAFLLLLGFPPPLPAQCNGDPALCAKRFDEVCYVTTHNAFNYQGPFFFPNQTHDITRQMTDGVRALMLDVHWYNGEPTVYHTSNWLGNQPLGDLLSAIKTFLDQHPNEVLSIIFESYITAAQMADAFSAAGLLPYLHTQIAGNPWPTLGDMITANQRLVVFTDVDDGQAYPWYHYVWDHAVETHWENHSRTDFSCDYNRGDSTNSLFILNHFVTQSSLGYGLIDSAAVVNAHPYITSRAMGCWGATGKIPNFLTVDFYEEGNVMLAKDLLNAGFVGNAGIVKREDRLQVHYNAHQGNIDLQWNGTPFSGDFLLFDLQGRMVLEADVSVSSARLSVPVAVGNGLYLYQLRSKTGMHSGNIRIVY